MSQNSEVQGLWHSLWPVSVSSPWADSQHHFISSSTSGTRLPHWMDVHITFSPASASGTKRLYGQILMQSDHSTRFHHFRYHSLSVLIHGPHQVSDPPCMSGVAHYAQALFAESSWPWLINEPLSPWLRQSHDVAFMWNEGHCLWPSSQSKHLFLSGDSLWNSADFLLHVSAY